MKTNILAKFIAITGLMTTSCFAQQPVVGAAPYQQPTGQAASYWDHGQSSNNTWTQHSGASCDSWSSGSTASCDSWSSRSSASCDSCSSGSCDLYDQSACGCDACAQAGGRSLFGGRMLSRLQPSEQCFDGFISPITNPFYNEDPRNLTEIRPVFASHGMPAALGGGRVNAYVVQLRARLSENVSLIAVKDGYFTSTSPLLQDGWADLGLGLKFNLIRDAAGQKLVSAGATFEAASGSSQAQQGLGSGNLNLFLSSARRFGGCWNHMASSGIRIPMNGDTGSASTWVSQHLSRPVTERLFVLTELNWFRYISSGTGGIPGIEALDFANLGSTDVTGNNIVTLAAGGKIRTARRSEIGAAYEVPISGRRDIFGNRVTAHWAIRY